MHKTLPITEAREHLRELVEQANRTMGRVIITRNGKPEAILMGYGEYESWVETLETLADPEEMAAIREGVAAARAGDVVSFEETFGHPLGAPGHEAVDPESRDLVPLHHLSEREVRVLQLLAGGMPLHGIGKRLQLSTKRIEAIKAIIMRKLGLSDVRRTDAKAQRRTAHQARR